MSTLPNTISVNGVDYVPADSIAADYDGELPGHVFIRTVTMHYVGRIIADDARFLILGDASWVADSGRLGEALATGKLAETEKFPDPVFINPDTIVDVTAWNHPLPKVSQ